MSAGHLLHSQCLPGFMVTLDKPLVLEGSLQGVEMLNSDA